MKSNQHLKEIASLFFKLGLIAFGGPAAHIAMMEEEVVNKRKWMSREHFLDLVGATNLIPGPNSTEMTMHCGHERGGVAGLFVAGICFIFPAAFLTGLLAFLYVEYGSLPEIEPFLYGIKPAVLAIIAGAIYKLGKKALKNTLLGLLGALVIMAAFLGVSEITAILGAGVLGLLIFGGRDLWQGEKLYSLSPLTLILASAWVGGKATTPKLFLVFLKVGAVLFGSGYVLVAYLEEDLVRQLGWLTQNELLDAIAIGQFTPGPVLSTSTFIGYQIQGFWGAIAATVGIFLPSFLFVWILNPIVPRLRKSKLASYFLDAVNIAAVGIMIAVTIQLGQNVLTDWRAWVIALLSIGATFGPKKLSSLWIVLGGAVLGYALLLIPI